MAIVGAGMVGRTVGLCLTRRGVRVVAVTCRTSSRADDAARFVGGGAVALTDAAAAATRGEIVLLTTPDDAIAEVCAAIAARGGFRRGALVAHTSGALSSEALAPARACGAATASLHPLQTFANPAEAVGRLPGTRWFYEGEESALARVRALIEACAGVPIPLRTDGKALYHAGAVLACNYAVTLTARAVGLLTAAGVPAAEALPALVPLLAGTLGNLERVGLPRALTGPIARGDTATVERHLAALARAHPEDAALYRLLGAATVPLAAAKGLDAERAAALRRLLSDPMTAPSPDPALTPGTTRPSP